MSVANSAPVLDQTTFDGLQELMGPDALGLLLSRLSQQLHEVGAALAAAEDRSAISRTVHKVVSAAGMLGFTDLSQACADLEAVCERGDQLGPAVERVRDAQVEALALIARMREAA